MEKHIATWNPVRGVWETGRASLLCEHSELYSETWPTSGTTRDGSAYALPTWAPRMAGSESSSLLPTPEAKLGSSGPDYAKAGRAESGGDDLQTAVARALLPTPTRRDGANVAGPSQYDRNSLPLNAAVMLLPTPNPFHSGNTETPEDWRKRRLDVFQRTGTRHGPALSVVALSVAEGDPLTPDRYMPDEE